MRVLFVTRTYPYPPNAGDLKFNAGLIEALSETDGTALHVFCGGGVPKVPKALPRVTWSGPRARPGRLADLRSLLGGLPRAAERAMPRVARQQLRRLIKSEAFDAIVLSESCVTPAAPLLTGKAGAVIYVSHNVDIDIRPAIARKVENPLLRLLQLRDARKYRRMEMDLLGRIDGVTAITREDAERYASLAPNVPCLLVQPGYSGTPSEPVPFAQTAPLAVVVGSFEWNAKLHNLRSILAAYERHLSGAESAPPRLRIAGRIGAKALEMLRLSHRSVEFTGEFDTLSEVTADARVALVLEDLGGGFKLKILDYVFSRLPIVALAPAMAGIDFEPGQDYLAVGSADEAFDVVARVIDDETRLRRMSDRALMKAADQFDWRDRARSLIAFAERLKTGSGDGV